jgi:hypothetical protein
MFLRDRGTAVGCGGGARCGRAGAAVHGDFETWAASSLDVHGRAARGAATRLQAQKGQLRAEKSDPRRPLLGPANLHLY